MFNMEIAVGLQSNIARQILLLLMLIVFTFIAFTKMLQIKDKIQVKPSLLKILQKIT